MHANVASCLCGWPFGGRVTTSGVASPLIDTDKQLTGTSNLQIQTLDGRKKKKKKKWRENTLSAVVSTL